MNIYFAASVTSGRAFEADIEWLIDLIESHGHTITNKVISDLRDLDKVAQNYSDSDIVSTMKAQMAQSDICIAEVSTVSHGVGYELGRCDAHNIPVHCLYHPKLGQKLTSAIT